jgi:hypothetical protein
LEYHINFEEFKYAMELFAWLDRNTHRTMHEEHIMWRDTAHEFHRIIMMNWPTAGRASRYLHILATHAWRFMPLSQWSTETMERFNMWMKYAKNYRSVPDKKEAKKKTMDPQYRYHQGVRQLIQIMKWTLSRSSSWAEDLRQRTKLQSCSRCHQKGHNMSTCSQRSMDTQLRNEPSPIKTSITATPRPISIISFDINIHESKEQIEEYVPNDSDEKRSPSPPPPMRSTNSSSSSTSSSSSLLSSSSSEGSGNHTSSLSSTPAKRQQRSSTSTATPTRYCAWK